MRSNSNGSLLKQSAMLLYVVMALCFLCANIVVLSRALNSTQIYTSEHVKGKYQERTPKRTHFFFESIDSSRKEKKMREQARDARKVKLKCSVANLRHSSLRTSGRASCFDPDIQIIDSLQHLIDSPRPFLRLA